MNRVLSFGPGVQVVESDADHALLSHANILVTLWYGVQEPSVCVRLYDLATQAAQASGTGKMSAVSIVRRRASAPSPAARDALSRLHEDPANVVHRSALVVPKTGFLESIVRSVAIGLRQRATRRTDHQIFATTEEALAWVIQDLPTAHGIVPSTDAMLVAVEQEDARRMADAT